MDINYKAIGVRIKAARARKGVTQGYIANLIGLSTPHISNIETGNTKLGLPTIIHLANVLDVSVDELLCDNIKRSEKIFQNELGTAPLRNCILLPNLSKLLKRTAMQANRNAAAANLKKWQKLKKLPNKNNLALAKQAAFVL